MTEKKLKKKKSAQKNMTELSVKPVKKKVLKKANKSVLPVNVLQKKKRAIRVKTRAKKNDSVWKKAQRLIVVNPFHFFIRHKYISISLASIAVISGITFYWFILKDIPSPSSLSRQEIPLTTLIRDQKGIVLYRIYKDANRVKLSWDQIPDTVKNATIAIEDSEYYNHFGISVRSIARAFLYNLQQKEINTYQGASTITMQLIKSRFFDGRKSYIRKIREMVLAPFVEFKYTKQQILTMYLNEVCYGGPACGIEAAAQMYFGIPAKQLNLAQAAFLAGLPAAPTIFSPFGANPHFATIRQSQVLDRMLELQMITNQDYEQTKYQQLVFAPQKIDIFAPHFVFLVKDALVQKFGEKMVTGGGLDVYTTLDLSVQQKAEEIVRKNVDQLRDRYHITNAATVITHPQTGEIIALVGSVNYFDTKNAGYVNVAVQPRQPGSSIKPVTYAYAFEQGFTPNTVLNDAPVVFVTPDSKEIYAPVNYDGQFHGLVTIRSALGNSYNVPAVITASKIGVPGIVQTGVKMGIKTWETPPTAGLSITLGGAEVTMLDMARAYGTIQNLGIRKELKMIKEIKDSNGTALTDRFYAAPLQEDGLVSTAQAEDSQQAISPIAAYWVTDILSDNNARMKAFGPYAKLTVPGHKVAVKTGTTNNFRDNWTIGFTPDYLVAAWVGNNDGSFMNKNLVSGITGAAPIWQETMSTLISDLPDKEFQKPSGLVPVKICAVNGLLTCPFCPQEKIEYYPVDKIPTKACYFRSKSDCEEAKKQTEGKSDEEKKTLLNGCWGVN